MSGELVSALRAIVGRRHLLTHPGQTARYATGYRFGGGSVLAVVRPGSLIEQWRVLNACVAADVIVVPQAANTGLTGGSTPFGQYDRDVVIVSTTRIAGIRPIHGGAQVICLSGATLFGLERTLAPLDREPHSVIGSSCIGASVVGGVCNNSGGALVRRGPAYTEYALYARVDEAGAVRLHNRLGVRLPDDPEDALAALDKGLFTDADVFDEGRAASARDYGRVVRDVDADTPARFNADPGRLFEASGSAGRVMVFAVRLDTFAREPRTTTFYIGVNDPGALTLLRRRVLLELDAAPIAGEYIHRHAFDVAARYGKDVFLAIRHLGTDRLPLFFALKARFDALASRTPFLPRNLADHVLQRLGALFPQHLPPRMRAFRDRFEHHLILKVAADGAEQARALLSSMFPNDAGDLFECTPQEADKAFLHRFAVAGAAVRYRAIHDQAVEDIIALDVALRRNDPDWVERLPPDVGEPIIVALYYGHFFCHVFHQDYIVRKGADPAALEHRMWALLDARGARYPAEHNVGHLYRAEPTLAEHYRSLDPGNRLNPGIGLTSRQKNWR